MLYECVCEKMYGYVCECGSGSGSGGGSGGGDVECLRQILSNMSQKLIKEEINIKS